TSASPVKSVARKRTRSRISTARQRPKLSPQPVSEQPQKCAHPSSHRADPIVVEGGETPFIAVIERDQGLDRMPLRCHRTSPGKLSVAGCVDNRDVGREKPYRIDLARKGRAAQMGLEQLPVHANNLRA